MSFAKTNIRPNGKVHAHANLFSMLDQSQLRALADDIDANGLHSPVVVDQCGTLLDGRNRVAACKIIGKEPETITYTGGDPTGFIVSANLKRRHLSASARALLGVKLIDIYKIKGNKLMAEAAKRLAAQRSGSVNFDRPSNDKDLRKKNGYSSRSEVAKAVEVKCCKIRQAEVVVEHAPDLINQVIKEEITLSKAASIAKGRSEGLDEELHKDCWYTPKWVFDQLGLIYDLDVCAPTEFAHRNAPAKKYLTEKDDGLTKPWFGLVWCNPPYSKPEPWADKLVQHANGLLLTHMPNNALWAVRAQRAATAVRLIQSMQFMRPNGEHQRPGYSLMLLAFGQQSAEALKKLTGQPGDGAPDMVGPYWIKQ